MQQFSGMNLKYLILKSIVAGLAADILDNGGKMVEVMPFLLASQIIDCSKNKKEKILYGAR